MGFFKKDRKGGKCGSYTKGNGIKGTNMSLGGYSIFKSESSKSESKDKPGRL